VPKEVRSGAEAALANVAPLHVNRFDVSSQASNSVEDSPRKEGVSGLETTATTPPDVETSGICRFKLPDASINTLLAAATAKEARKTNPFNILILQSFKFFDMHEKSIQEQSREFRGLYALLLSHKSMFTWFDVWLFWLGLLKLELNRCHVELHQGN
jgi:hypothetical protein